MKVLLTGGLGYLGEYLLAELLKRDHTVWALYRTDLSRLKTVRFVSGLGVDWGNLWGKEEWAISIWTE